MGFGNTDKQNIHYLHGALHLFDARIAVKKYTWCNTGIRLIQQIREALDLNLFPLIVAEGTSDQKLERIMHSNYLSRCYRSMASITGSLFIYGHSMHENDAHILDLLRRNRRLRHILVGLFGDPASTANQRLIKTMQLLAEQRRSQGRATMISFYDAVTAHVWQAPTASNPL